MFFTPTFSLSLCRDLSPEGLCFDSLEYIGIFLLNASFRRTYPTECSQQVPASMPLKQCKICGKTFKSVYHLKRHEENVHTSTRKFSCDKCQLVFKRKEHLKDHQAAHTSERRFKCEICDYNSSWKCNLVHHMKKFHNI